MALSELAEIRALLIAQTDTPEPRRAPGLLGVVGGLLRSRTDPPAPAKPLNLSAQPRRFSERRLPPREASMLWLGEALDDDIFALLEPPVPPRAEFGVRSPRPYLPHDSVLLLNKVASARPRRLTLLTDAGEAVGEIFLTPQEAPVRAHHSHADGCEAHYVSGDLEDAPAPAAVLPPAQKPSYPNLERDLLGALAIALSREHDALGDRLIQAGRHPA